MADVGDDATGKEFAALIGQNKDKEALAAAEAAAAKDQPIGHFLIGWAAESGKGGEADAAKAEKSYREGAKRAHVPSVTNLATLLLRQNSSSEEAAKLLRSVLEQDPKIAGFVFGVACLSGATGTPDFQSAAQMWTKSAAAGQQIAYRHLGLLYQGALGFPAQADLKKAAEAFKSGSDAGDDEAAIRLGILILQAGDKIDRKPTEAAKWFEKASASNNPAALFLLGQVREQGVEGTAADPTAARGIYKKAVEQGYAPAMLRLGTMLERGLGGDMNREEALKLYRKAAELGEAGAYFQLGVLTQKGEGVEKNETEAFRLLLQAGQRGFAPAANSIGMAYRAGQGAAPDMIAAAAWFDRAAQGGETNAMVSLAEMMLSNQGVPMNTEVLTKLTQTAFNAGNPRAGLLLGKMAERGVVFNKDVSQALALYRWAGKRELEEAKKSAAELEKSLTKEQIQASETMLKQLEEKPKDKPADAPKSPIK